MPNNYATKIRLWGQKVWGQLTKSSKKNRTLILLLLLALVLRIINLGYPKDYIFDEVYHAFTAREYLDGNIAAWEWWTTPPPGVAYEWTHPPIAKYGMELGMMIFGQSSFGWRLGSAVAGVASLWALYLLIISLTKNKTAALLAVFLGSIDGLHLVQSRIAMNDSYMLMFLLWSLYSATKAKWKSAAVLYGLALGSKWSALYGLVPLAFMYLHSWKGKLTVRLVIYQLGAMLRLLAITIIVYVLTFAPFIIAGHDWAQFVELHRQMWYYHTHLIATHNYQSTPLQWIFAARPVWYFVSYGDTTVGNIYAQANPLILWLGLVALIFNIQKLRLFPHLLLYLSYLIFVIPWIFSPRIMFFYHYLPSSIFLIAILSLWLSYLPRHWRTYLVTLCILVSIILSPLWYGLAVPHLYTDTLFRIFPSWQ